jgi:hypothetical protein
MISTIEPGHLFSSANLRTRGFQRLPMTASGNEEPYPPENRRAKSFDIHDSIIILSVLIDKSLFAKKT